MPGPDGIAQQPDAVARQPDAVDPQPDGVPRPQGVVLQRLVLVLPSTGAYDSRTYRIASAAAARGHDVTVLGRAAPDLPALETHPSGYRIVRVAVSAVDGLPLPGAARARLSRWWFGRNSRAPAGTADQALDQPTQPATRGGRALGAIGQFAATARRMAAIGLTVRSQSRASRAVQVEVDVYHGMGYMGIPVALDLARRDHGKVVYDARDIYVDAGNLARLPSPVRRVLGTLERGWARAADRVVTVNQPYADVMAARWAVRVPAVILNCPYRFQPAAQPERRFHDRLGLPASTRVVLYHGGFSRGRGIEQLLAAIPGVPDAVLVLLGYGVLEEVLRARSKSAALSGRVYVLPAVAPTELLSWVASADVAAMPIQPTTLNHRLTTPNKLFEALAAGVPVVASDLPGMGPIVRETGAGLLVDPTDPKAIAEAIREILDAPEEVRRQRAAHARAAADGPFNWETQVARLFEEYERLTGRPW